MKLLKRLWPKIFIPTPPSRKVQTGSILERLEGLIPPVEEIQKSYQIDKRIALAGHKAMLATEELIKEVALASRRGIVLQELLLEQQAITGDIIDIQVNKQLNADTIILNFHMWLTDDSMTIGWILENALIPAFALGFADQDEARQRVLFNSLYLAMNKLQRIDGGVLDEPEK